MADVEHPLLQEEEEEKLGGGGGIIGDGSGFHVVGCPGCAINLRKIAGKGAPTKELIFVAVLVLCNSLPISSLFPFIYFMVEDFHIAKSDTKIAYYAGFIGSVFMLGRFIASTPWGLAADRYGRKPVIIFGTVSILIFNSTFGFSTTFWMALLSRFLLGIFNGLLGTIRAYISEICTEEQQAFGMSLVGTMWGLGLIIGPAIGGYLAQPSSKYPGIFPTGSIFDEFPYALPCLCISAFAAVSLVMSFWVPIFSLWAVSPETLGGLEMTTSNVGVILAISGVALLLFQMLLYPRLQKLLGPIQTSRISAILSVPLVAIFPLIAQLNGAWLWAIVISASILKTILSVSVMTASFILINNAVTSDQRGVANGVSMAFMSLFKAIGPASAGALLSWAETRLDASFLPGTWMVFSILAVFCFFTIVVSFEPILPRSLDHPEPEPFGVQSLTLQRQASFNI